MEFLIGDTILQAFNAMVMGDESDSMPIVLDDNTDYLGN
jgi:hypothetical protein